MRACVLMCARAYVPEFARVCARAYVCGIFLANKSDYGNGCMMNDIAAGIYINALPLCLQGLPCAVPSVFSTPAKKSGCTARPVTANNLFTAFANVVNKHYIEPPHWLRKNHSKIKSSRTCEFLRCFYSFPK